MAAISQNGFQPPPLSELSTLLWIGPHTFEALNMINK